MEYIISQELRDKLIKYLANSTLPAREANAFCRLLSELKPVSQVEHGGIAE